MGIELNNLKPPEGSKKKKQRVGRGSGSNRGTFSGRGVKGQNARSGGGVPPGFEGGQTRFIKRIPKRGFNRKKKIEISTVNVGDLNQFKDGEEVNKEELVKKGLVEESGRVKILGDGKLEKKLTVNADKFSSNAREKIEKAGGEAVENA